MSLRRFLFQNAAAGLAYFDSSQDSDDLNLNSIAIKMGSSTGTAIDLNTNDIANVRKLTLVTGSGGVTLDGGGQRATNFATPTQNSDLVTKAYADAIQSGLDWKLSARVASTANVTVSAPGAAIDGVTLATNDRVLLKNQTTGSENGIYTFQGSGSPMTRASDAVAGQLTSGAAVFVTEGTANASSGWLLTTPDPITVGTTSQTWTQFTALGMVTAGAGLTQSGSVINVGAGVGGTTCDGITITTDAFAVNLDTNAGLQFDASSPKKVQVKLVGGAGTANTAGGLSLSASGLGISLATSSGLSIASGLAVGAGNGITVGASSISVTANTAQGINVGGSGVGITLNGTNPGLAFTSTYVDVKYGNGVQASASGVTLKINATGTASVAGGLDLTASGLGISLGTNSCHTVTSGLQLQLSGGAGTAGTAGGLVAGATGLSLSLASSNPGLTVASGLAVLIDATTTGGLTANANGIAVKLNGTTLQLSAASGLSVLGVPAAGTWQIGGSATSANVTAANLNTLTGGGDASALHTHAGLASSSVAVTITAGAGGLNKGDPVYLSANNTCLKGDPSNAAKSVLVGIVSAAIGAASQGNCQTSGILTGVGSSWTYGQEIFMSNTGGMTNDPTTITSRYRTIRLGIAMNATDLLVAIDDRGVRP